MGSHHCCLKATLFSPIRLEITRFSGRLYLKIRGQSRTGAAKHSGRRVLEAPRSLTQRKLLLPKRTRDLVRSAV